MRGAPGSRSAGSPIGGGLPGTVTRSPAAVFCRSHGKHLHARGSSGSQGSSFVNSWTARAALTPLGVPIAGSRATCKGRTSPQQRAGAPLAPLLPPLSIFPLRSSGGALGRWSALRSRRSALTGSRGHSDPSSRGPSGAAPRSSAPEPGCPGSLRRGCTPAISTPFSTSTAPSG